MAPVIGAPAGTIYTLRTYKKLKTSPLAVWSNFYEFVGMAESEESTIDELLDKMLSYERSFHLDSVEFDRFVFSTWVEDGEPYDPESFVTKPMVGDGARTHPTNIPEPLTTTLFIRRQTGFGQNGKILYRRCVYREEKTSPSGTPALSGSEVQTAFNLGKEFIEQELGLAAGAVYRLCMFATGQPMRTVNNLIVAGLRNTQFNNRYFDVP